MKAYLFCTVLFIGSMMRAEIDKNLLKKYLPDNPVIIDAGAHDGRSSIELSAAWPKGIIHAFEPVSGIFNEMKERVSSYKNIIPYELAFGDSIGKQTIYISKGRGDGSSSLLKPTGHLTYFPDVTFQQSVEVQVTTLDAWAQEFEISHVDLLWLDMQGVELQVLQASPNILKTVKAIFTEINLTSLYEGCALYSTLKQWLESQGFKEVYKKMQHPTFGDALFVKQ